MFDLFRQTAGAPIPVKLPLGVLFIHLQLSGSGGAEQEVPLPVFRHRPRVISSNEIIRFLNSAGSLGNK